MRQRETSPGFNCFLPPWFTPPWSSAKNSSTIVFQRCTQLQPQKLWICYPMCQKGPCRYFSSREENDPGFCGSGKANVITRSLYGKEEVQCQRKQCEDGDRGVKERAVRRWYASGFEWSLKVRRAEEMSSPKPPEGAQFSSRSVKKMDLCCFKPLS